MPAQGDGRRVASPAARCRPPAWPQPSPDHGIEHPRFAGRNLLVAALLGAEGGPFGLGGLIGGLRSWRWGRIGHLVEQGGDLVAELLLLCLRLLPLLFLLALLLEGGLT